jgi:D-alanyl-D-alanine carboxypeptidase (penicillin-binding protein 5/6)
MIAVRRAQAALALVAATLTVAIGSLGVAPRAGAAASPSATAPGPCAVGLTPSHLVTPPVPSLASPQARAARAGGIATLRADGSIDRLACLPASPVPLGAPTVAADHVVGGPALATTGVVTDRPAGVPPPPDTAHVSYVLADLDTGEILAAKNPHAWLLPASTLKALTALVVIPALDTQRIVLGADEDTQADGTRVGITVGGTYTVGDLLNGLILSSGNDAAYALARAYGGRPALISAMNARAGKLGAWDTVAVDPSGLDADGQHSSAYDLALIARAVMRLPDYAARASLPRTMFPGGLIPASPTTKAGGVVVAPTASLTSGPPFQIDNHNQLLGVYPGVIGVKNGYTSQARNTYVGAVRVGGRTLLITTMGSPEAQAPSAIALLDWGFAYASRVHPVGTLVAEGSAPQPPELGGPVPTPTATAASTATAAAPWTGTSSTLVGSGEASASAGVTPVERALAAAVSGWWGGLPDVGRWGLIGLLVVVLALASALAVRRWRSRVRGAYQR